MSLWTSTIVYAQVDSLERVQEIGEVEISFDPNATEFYARKNSYILDIEKQESGLLILLKTNNNYYLEKVSWSRELIFSTLLDFNSSAIEKIVWAICIYAPRKGIKGSFCRTVLLSLRFSLRKRHTIMKFLLA
jgi:hypothetical protein